MARLTRARGAAAVLQRATGGLARFKTGMGAEFHREAIRSPAKSGGPPQSSSRGRGRGGLLLRGGFFALEVGDAALAFFALIVLFAHIFFTLL
jgi:hypothetical protein